MGLAGQKDKQRISQDPNNLFWSKDESKFGFKMLQKMGWAPGKGLGVNEDGKQEHVKIRLKDNNLGVGATKKSINNWLGNTDAFSRLLADLNSQSNSEASSVNGDAEEVTEEIQVQVVEEEEEQVVKKEKKSKKEKKEKKDKKKKEKKEKKEKKSKKRDREEEDQDSEKKSKKSKKDKKKKSKEEAVSQPVVLRNAARAKFLRAKRMASTGGDQSRLNEILGIKAEKPSTTIIESAEVSFMPSFSV